MKVKDKSELQKDIKKALIDRDMTLKELASKVGRGYQNLSKQLAGYQSMSEDTIRIVREFLGVDVHDSKYQDNGSA